MTARAGATFYWWATLALGCLLIVAVTSRAWMISAVLLASDGLAYWRLKASVRAWRAECRGVILGKVAALTGPRTSR